MHTGKVTRGLRSIAILIGIITMLGLSTWRAHAQSQPLPDLTVDTELGFTNEGRDQQGNCIGKLRVTVKNKGTANADTFTVAVTIGQTLYTIEVPNLQNGASTTLVPHVTVAVGTHLVRVLADAGHVVAESNEVNNSAARYATCAGEAR